MRFHCITNTLALENYNYYGTLKVCFVRHAKTRLQEDTSQVAELQSDKSILRALMHLKKNSIKTILWFYLLTLNSSSLGPCRKIIIKSSRVVVARFYTHQSVFTRPIGHDFVCGGGGGGGSCFKAVSVIFLS